MKFTTEHPNIIEDAIKKMEVKGKYLKDGGLLGGKLKDYFYCSLKDNTLSFWNGNTTFVVNYDVHVEGIEDGEFFGSITKMLAYMKKFKGETTFSVGDFVSVSDGSKKASIPKVVNHPDWEAIERIKGMLSHVVYQPTFDTLWHFGKSQFEGAFQMFGRDFQEAISLLELCRSGVYKLDFDGNECNLSSNSGIENSFITPTLIQQTGEPATLEYSSPLHSFFDKDELINFYVKDAFPLLIVSHNKKVLKAPFMAGN